MKEKCYKLCIEFVEDRISSLQEDVKLIRKSVGEDTKSSAGDKYETSREMMKQEENKAMASLSILNSQLKLLNNLTLQVRDKVELGSLVVTDKGSFFISTALGVLKVGEDKFFAISTDAPIYEVLKGKKAGDLASFNGNSYRIIEVQ